MTRDSGAGENPLFRFPAFKSGVKIPHQYKISMNPESSRIRFTEEKSFEMIQKSTDELRELLSLHSKKNF